MVMPSIVMAPDDAANTAFEPSDVVVTVQSVIVAAEPSPTTRIAEFSP
jgi:hypothetical protein